MDSSVHSQVINLYCLMDKQSGLIVPCQLFVSRTNSLALHCSCWCFHQISSGMPSSWGALKNQKINPCSQPFGPITVYYGLPIFGGERMRWGVDSCMDFLSIVSSFHCHRLPSHHWHNTWRYMHCGVISWQSFYLCHIPVCVDICVWFRKGKTKNQSLKSTA